MNAIIHKSEIEEQIKNYKDYIPLTKDNDSMFKLMREIHRLVNINTKIKAMNFDQLTTEFEVQINVRSSIINYPKKCNSTKTQ